MVLNTSREHTEARSDTPNTMTVPGISHVTFSFILRRPDVLLPFAGLAPSMELRVPLSFWPSSGLVLAHCHLPNACFLPRHSCFWLTHWKQMPLHVAQGFFWCIVTKRFYVRRRGSVFFALLACPMTWLIIIILLREQISRHPHRNVLVCDL